VIEQKLIEHRNTSYLPKLPIGNTKEELAGHISASNILLFN